MRRTEIAVALVAALFVPAVASAALFHDDFNSAASAGNYDEATTGVTAVTYAFDYSSMGIPPAPNTTDGTTLGVKLEANMNTGVAGVASGVTLHTMQQFTGSYSVKFDAWINANGPFPGGGAGSTEFLTAGVGGDGTTVNRVGVSGIGGYTAVDGEGGSGIDYRLYKDITLQDPASGQYAASEPDTRRWSNPHYAQFGDIDVAALPVQGVDNGGPAQQTGSTNVGTFGFAWHEVELVVDAAGGTGGAASVAWYIDGLLIGTLDSGIGAAFATDGSVTIGYADPFTSLSDNNALSFGLIDNLTVIPEPASAVLCFLAAGGMLFARRRRGG